MTPETKEKTKKILGIVGNVLIWVFVAFAVVITALVFAAQGSEDGVPSLFGKSLITISTGSMDPTYKIGDMVFMEKLDDDDDAKSKLQKGDIITYKAPIDINGDGSIGDINTHRIEDVVKDKNGVVTGYITKGDANTLTDMEGDTPYPTLIKANDIVGKCTEKGKLPLLGGAISWLRSPLGFFLCVVLPMILFFLYELYNFISILVTERARRAAEAVSENEEEIKRRAIEEYINSQKANAAPSGSAAETPDTAEEDIAASVDAEDTSAASDETTDA